MFEGNSFHISRWKFWYGYLLIFITLILTIYFRDRAFDVLAWVFGIITLVLLVVFEVLIRREKIIITDKHIEHVLRGHSVKIEYSGIGGVSVIQTPFEMFLRTGSVVIDTPGSHQSEISLVMFHEPSKIAKLILGHIAKHHAGHGH